jgi:hypothetical protein
VSKWPNLSPETGKTIIGIGVLIQVLSLIVMAQLWRHHHHWYYVLPVSLIGCLMAIVPFFLVDRSDPK